MDTVKGESKRVENIWKVMKCWQSTKLRMDREWKEGKEIKDTENT